MRLVPKNWHDFQHYKDRSPPWIRLHRRLLDDREFHALPVESRALAPMLWLLASESVTGEFDGDPVELAFRLRSNEKAIRSALQPLLERHFFIVVQDASNVLAECGQVAVPETETETETEQRQKAPQAAFAPPDWIPSETWTAYLAVRKSKRSGNGAHALSLIVKDLEKFRMEGHDPLSILETSVKSGWTGVFAPKPQQNGRAPPSATVPLNPAAVFVPPKPLNAEERVKAGEALKALQTKVRMQ